MWTLSFSSRRTNPAASQLTKLSNGGARNCYELGYCRKDLNRYNQVRIRGRLSCYHKSDKYSLNIQY
jgi:hypothetical protein